jgi:hypothetical protein
VLSEVVFDVYEAAGKRSRPSLLYCGDDQSAKGSSLTSSATQFRSGGHWPAAHRPIQRAFALLVARLAYEGKDGPELAYRFERFGKGLRRGLAIFAMMNAGTQSRRVRYASALRFTV